MLIQWQEKYPTTFDDKKVKIKQLTSVMAEKIGLLLNKLDEKKLVNEDIVSLILDKSSHIDNIQNILAQLMPLECLNISIVTDILENSDHIQLHEYIAFLKANALLNEKILSIITSSVNPQIIFSFIAKLSAANLEVMSIFNNEHVIDSLYDLIFLLDCSTLEYCAEEVPFIFQLARILANPMASAIFNSWNRGDSPYTMAVEPYSKRIDPLEKYTQADRIIRQLKSISDFETQLKVFFDLCAQHRFLPNSIKNMDDMTSDGDIELLVLKAFGICHNNTFNAIKYDVAAEVVSINWYSTLGYDELMSQIKVQVDLLQTKEAKNTNFVTPIKTVDSSKTYQPTISPLNEFSMFGKRKAAWIEYYEMQSDDGYEASGESTNSDSETEKHVYKRQNLFGSEPVSPSL